MVEGAREGSMLVGFGLAALAAPVRFVALGDSPYAEEQVAPMAAAIGTFDDSGASFAVHVGDLLPGGTPCDDTLLTGRRDLFAASPIPFLYTPGDNDWTDCAADPLDRLVTLRRMFFTAPLGGGVLPREVQEGWPENQRWTVDGVVFATFHVVGSHDDRGGHPAEAEARRAADLAWLSATWAAAAEARAVVLFQQADPRYGKRHFRTWTDALAAGAAASPVPVLVVHGDSHVELPPEAGWLGEPRLWRAIVPGEQVAPRLVTVDPDAAAPFAMSALP